VRLVELTSRVFSPRMTGGDASDAAEDRREGRVDR